MKILVISHNAFDMYNNMGKTLATFFKEYEQKDIVQLCFHSTEPNIKICESTYQLTDFDILKSIFTIQSHGRIIGFDEIKNSQGISKTSGSYQIGKKKTAGKLLLRDLVWKFGNWKSKELINWLDNNKPDVIFFAAGYSMFSSNIAMFIGNKYSIPLVTYFCDDYYDFSYSSYRGSLTSKVRLKLFRNNIKEVVGQSQELVFINQSMMEKYKNLFGKSGQVIMTPYEICQSESKTIKKPLIMSFIGNISGNRWKTLRRIGKELEKINSNGLNIVLNIYSITGDQEIISKLSIGNSVIFKGAANAEMVKEIYHESDILLHVESFAPEDVCRVKYSISTKIADCLASNRAFLAVGPSGIASIDYLKENNAAYIIDEENMIENKLNEYFIINDIDDQIIKNAKGLSKKNHDILENSKRLKNIFKNIVKE
ncbi:hypothetical protein ACSU64_17235 [Bacillaceae bacterium C204]|uniref:hypothetical protein n=1 Tax=Neobacillus sp. 204 TaxID=3383351 RepID=UPI00397B44AE